MLFLRTGLPGAGKTLLTLAEVVAFSKTGEKERQVYYHNIDFDKEHKEFEQFKNWKSVTCADLTEHLPLLKTNEHPTMQDKSIILVDEAHLCYLMHSRTKPFDYSDFFTTHRHYGLDFFFITQTYKQLAPSIIDLVNDHKDYKRLANSSFVACLSDASVIVNRKQVTAISSKLTHPKKLFGVYKSSVLHTHKLKLNSKVLFIIGFLVVAISFLVYQFTSKPLLEPNSKNTNISVDEDIVPAPVLTKAQLLSKAKDDLLTVFLSQHEVFVTGEFQFGNQLEFFFSFYVIDGSRFFTLNSFEMLRLGLKIKRISSNLYLLNNQVVTPRGNERIRESSTENNRTDITR